MKTTLVERALKIKEQEQTEEQKAISARQREIDSRCENILESFKRGFKDEVPLLTDEGITFSAHFTTNYEHQGTYIMFKRGDKSVKMDFSNEFKYRYEYTRPEQAGSMVYAEWDKDKFIVFIYDNLF